MIEERKEELRLLYVGDLKAMADGTYKTYKEPAAHPILYIDPVDTELEEVHKRQMAYKVPQYV